MYAWKSGKTGCVHEIDPATGKPYCKMDHSTAWKLIDVRGDSPPTDRRSCSICVGIKNNQLRKKAAPKTSDEFRRSKEFLQSQEWKRLRYQVLLKYGARCMLCGARSEDGATIQVDHIKPRYTHPELALSIDNLQVLCAMCNHGKGSWDQTDWRSKQRKFYG